MNDNKTSKNSIVAKFAVPISFLILFFLAANFTDCDLVTFWKRRSHLTDLGCGYDPARFFLYSENPAATFLHHSDVRYWNGTWYLFCPCTLAFWRCKLRISSCNAKDS